MTSDSQTTASLPMPEGVFNSVPDTLSPSQGHTSESGSGSFGHTPDSLAEVQVEATSELEEDKSEYGSKQATSSALESISFNDNADYISQWQLLKGSSGQTELRCIARSAEPPTELEAKMRPLVQDAIAQQKVLSRLFVRSKRHYVVVAPLPEFSDQALCVAFPLELDSSDSVNKETRARLQHWCSEVALAAATWSIAKLRQATLKQQAEIQQFRSRAVGSSPAPLATPANEPTDEVLAWAELWRAAGKRLKASVAAVGSNSRNMAIVTVLVMLAAFIPFPFQVVAKVTCEPAERRYVAAPFDAKLLESKVRLGEEVVEGQLLAVLDGKHLASQIAIKQAELAQATQRRMAALTVGDASDAELERLEVDRLSNETKILEQRQKRIEIRSPLTGIVVAGNLERAAGSSLELGEELFEIAPLDQLVAEVAISEQDIAYVQSGIPARISLDAWGGNSHRTQLLRIHPRSELRDGESVFVAEADITDSQFSMRPGMQGSARISSGWKPLGWVLLHRPYEAFRRWSGW
ncbi:MAG: efflux RND transporter periplasmic adaptor subunit [Planctomycetota bacterium]